VNYSASEENYSRPKANYFAFEANNFRPENNQKTGGKQKTTLEEEERGKRVYYSARWVNNTSQHGP